MPPRKPQTIDEILKPLPVDRRAVMERMRAILRSAAPRAEECISYMLPAFRQDGRALVAFGAAKRHVALYPMGSAAVAQFEAELAAYDHDKGTIRFAWDRPLPAMLIRRIVKARLAENAARAAAAGGAAKKKLAAPARRKPVTKRAAPAARGRKTR